MMNTLVRVGVVVGAAAWIVLAPFPPKDAPSQPANPPVQTIEEDEPGWDCQTMGNHICGPGMKP